MKIACYGYVGKEVGSVAGANFLVLEELLKRGVEIDFFGWSDFNPPQGLLHYPNLRFVDLPKSSIATMIRKKLPRFLQGVYQTKLQPIVHTLIDLRSDRKTLEKAVTQKNDVRHYDVLLFLGMCSSFRVQDISTVSWVQGPPQTEWQYIQKLKWKIFQQRGFWFYWLAAVHYNLEASKVRREVGYSDILICGSHWSRDRMIEYGMTPNRLQVLPYPMNLELFQLPPEIPHCRSKTTFLWLGRIDPRKRFDLLMAAYELLLQERQDVHLKVVGQFRHVSGYRKLMEPFLQNKQLEYLPFVPRSEIPALLHQCDVVVQPSEAENFGSSVPEAMCCGLPVVLGPTNGTKDFIGEAGIVFEDYTPEALKDAMVQAIEQLERDRTQIALRNRRIAEQQFRVDRIVDQLVQILQETTLSENTGQGQERRLMLKSLNE